MANTKRRYIDRNGNQFMPMSVEGNVSDGRFMTSTKWVTLGIILAMAVFIYFILMDTGTKFNYVACYTLWFICSFYAIRYIVFEEKFYYAMYQKLKENRITTPAEFWDIVSIDDTESGAILTFSDAKIAILIKLERDTIIGKDSEFKETHYDAISDFYKDLILKNYPFLYINTMERAGSDPRLNEISKVIYKNDNRNIQLILEDMFGYIKNITRSTLYESDYYMIYTYDMSRVDMIIEDTIEAVYKLMNGAYIGYRVLSEKDITELVSEKYEVTYFDSVEATLKMSKNNGYDMKSPFVIDEVRFKDGKSQKIGKKEQYTLNRITSGVLEQALDSGKTTIKDAIYKEEIKKEDVLIGFEDISKGLSVEADKAASDAKFRMPQIGRGQKKPGQDMQRKTGSPQGTVKRGPKPAQNKPTNLNKPRNVQGTVRGASQKVVKDTAKSITEPLSMSEDMFEGFSDNDFDDNSFIDI